MPKSCLTRADFPFYTEQMWDYEFQNRFAEWLPPPQREPSGPAS